MATIGFIGLGNMGAPMARNLIAAGHRLHVYDVSPDAVAATVAAGAAAAPDIARACYELGRLGGWKRKFSPASRTRRT